MDDVARRVKSKPRYIHKRRVLNWLFTALAVAIAAVRTIGSGEAQTLSFSFHAPSVLKIGKDSFDLATESGLTRLKNHADEILARHTEKKSISKRDARGLAEIFRLAGQWSTDPLPAEQAGLQQKILEIASAIANNHRPSVPSYVGLLDLPFRAAAAMHNPVARGHKAASNIRSVEGVSDLSGIDPENSTYWARPDSISSANLYAGFGRAEVPSFDQCLWSYAGPKKSGANAGCDLVCESRRVKVKFAEAHSEPFIGRIFHALGYNVDPSDYVPRLRIRYDRRFFTEFNSRRPIKMKIGVLFIPIYAFHFEERYDPFAYIDHAVLKGARTVSGRELKQRLLRDPQRKHAETDRDNFRTEVESEIECLVTVEANIQVEQKTTRNIGPWDFDGLGRQHLRELRAAGVLAAWVGWWDSRFENTRVRLVQASGGPELKHFFTDLGSGLGRSGGTFSHSSEEPNDFSWSFTRGALVQRKGESAWRFEITDFEPITETKAFKEITLDDARWMARLIAQLSEEQVVSALIASGFDSAEVRIYTEKLLARRHQLIRDVRLEKEFSLLRTGEQNQRINYDPAVAGPVRIRRENGTELEAPVGRNIVRYGRVERRPQER